MNDIAHLPTGRELSWLMSRRRRSIRRARIVMDLLRRIAFEQSAAIIVVTHDEMILDLRSHLPLARRAAGDHTRSCRLVMPFSKRKSMDLVSASVGSMTTLVE